MTTPHTLISAARRVRAITFFFASAALAAHAADAPPAVAAASSPLELGLWEVVTTPEIAGLPMMMGPKVDRFCLAAEAIAKGLVPLRAAATCAVQAGVWAGQNLALQVGCGPAFGNAAASGTLAASGKTFASNIEIITHPAQDGQPARSMKFAHTGRWVQAACPAGM